MQDNLEFLQWMKKHWDLLRGPGQVYDASGRAYVTNPLPLLLPPLYTLFDHSWSRARTETDNDVEVEWYHPLLSLHLPEPQRQVQSLELGSLLEPVRSRQLSMPRSNSYKIRLRNYNFQLKGLRRRGISTLRVCAFSSLYFTPSRSSFLSHYDLSSEVTWRCRELDFELGTMSKVESGADAFIQS